MILDEFAEFADKTALNTGAANSYLVGDVIDLGTPARDIGDGEPVFFVVQVTTLLASATGVTAIGLMSHSAETIVGGVMHVVSPAQAAAVWVKGYQWAVSLPRGVKYGRYLGVVQVQTIAALTAGAINAFLTHDAAKYQAYPRNLVA